MRFAVLILAASLALAEKPDVEQLLGLARSAPPEIASATMLKLAESRQVAPEQQQQLFEEAFSIAARAQALAPLYTEARLTPDTKESYQFAASKLRLDRLSLQLRAVQGMLAVDPQAAAEMFQRVTLPVYPPMECGAAAVPDFSAYFETAAQLFAKGYSAQQRKDGEDVRDLQRWMAAVRSPFDVEKAVKLAEAVEGDARPLAFVTLLGRLSELEVSWPVFSTGLRAAESAYTLLAQDYRQLGGDPVLPASAWRSYLVRHARGPRCKDTRSDFSGAIARLNRALPKGVSPIEAREQEPAKIIDPPPAAPELFRSEETSAIAAALRELRMRPDGRAWTDTDRSSIEWRRAFDSAVTLVRAWSSGANESEIDWFHQKATALRALYEAAPPGEERALALRELMNFLAASGVQQARAADWAWHVTSVQFSGIIGPSGETDRVRIAMKEAGSASLRVLAQMDEWGLPVVSLSGH
jgi:hypothetical protein